MRGSGEGIPQLQKILRYFTSIINIDVSYYCNQTADLVLPSLSEKNFIMLASLAKNIFQNEPTVLDIQKEVIVVGDLHGHLMDLFRILKKFGFPPKRSYLFLGDIVDRGEFSTETLMLILLLKVLHSDHVYLIRGNHEFADVTECAGFTKELMSIYDSLELKDTILNMFTYIPIGATIFKKCFCVHGGIGPDFTDLSQLKQFRKPVEDSIGTLVETCVWSDPLPNGLGYLESNRGGGYVFGDDVFAKFMRENSLDLFIRAHECVLEGVMPIFGKRFLTVFSASNYCNVANNMAGVCRVSGQLGCVRHEITTFEPLRYVMRHEARFTTDYSLRVTPPLTPRLPSAPKRDFGSSTPNTPRRPSMPAPKDDGDAPFRRRQRELPPVPRPRTSGKAMNLVRPNLDPRRHSMYL